MAKKRREIEPVEIHNLSDIRSVIAPFLEQESRGDPVEIRTELKGFDNKTNSTQKFWTSVPSPEMNSYQTLIEGFNLVKIRTEMAGKANAMATVEDEDDELLPERIRWSLLDIDSQFFSIDTFIRNRLGGKRKGLRIRWDVEDGVYEFDPYAKKLFQVKDE